MTALVKCKSKGVVWAQYVSSAYVAQAGLVSIDISGEKDETVDTTTLDGSQYKTKEEILSTLRSVRAMRPCITLKKSRQG